MVVLTVDPSEYYTVEGSHTVMDAIWRDVRHALRAARKRPAFSALVIVTLALGIGVNTASFAVGYGIFVRPLPYSDPSRIVIVNLRFADGGDLGFSPGALQDWLARLRTVDVAAGYYTRDVTVRRAAESVVIPAAVVTDRFFDVMGTRAEAGRTSTRLDTPQIVVGRRALKQFSLRSPQESLDDVLSVSDTSYAIAGVVPSAFAFPSDDIGLWLPSRVLVSGTTSDTSGYSKIVARIKLGVTIAQVREDANRVRVELNPTSRDTVSVMVLRESLFGKMQTLLLVALAGALLVLLVACANVATLFIGRDVAGQREIAVRSALGAGTGQLVRALLIETLIIASAASLAGMALALAALKIFASYASGSIPGLHRVTMPLPVVLVICALTIVVTLLCSAVPAWHAARADRNPFLGASHANPNSWRVRGGLVIAQIACSFVLLIGAGLLVRTVSVLMHEEHGFQPDGALEAKAVLSDTVLFTGRRTELFVDGLLQRVRAMPGVLHAGFGTNLPPRPPPIVIALRLISDNRDETRFMKLGSATPGYLRALGARFLAGRDFDEGDGRSGAAVVILSESAARFCFPNEDPLGKTMPRLPRIIGSAGKPTVIGVVGDIKYEGLDSPAGSAVYVPWAARPLGSGYLIVRTSGNPMRVASAVRQTARTLDPTVPIPELQSLYDAMAESIAYRRLREGPAVGFGLLALAVACIGLLATLLSLVAERRRDIAIRCALGASPGQLVSAILVPAAALTAAGLLLGLAVGIAAARSLSGLLYSVGPYDAMTFLGTTLLIGGGAMLATYIAARQARGVDPLMILRNE
jgi:putative ABC transport system permease protein